MPPEYAMQRKLAAESCYSCTGGIFAPFIPGPIEELKVKELKNGRLAMLAFAGFVMSAQARLHEPCQANILFARE